MTRAREELSQTKHMAIAGGDFVPYLNLVPEYAGA